ncbi:hypothetical protein ES705_25554 [subsurface metagenome]
MGRLKGETTMTEQAYRYPKDTWTVSQARKHCKDHDGILFEPATGKAEEDEKEEKEDKLGFTLDEIYQMKKDNIELKEKLKDLELKAGAVLNAKNNGR